MAKKKILFVCCVLAIGISVWLSQKNKRELSVLQLINIEALAEQEAQPPITCVHLGTVDCPISESKVKVIMQGLSLGNDAEMY